MESRCNAWGSKCFHNVARYLGIQIWLVKSLCYYIFISIANKESVRELYPLVKYRLLKILESLKIKFKLSDHFTSLGFVLNNFFIPSILFLYFFIFRVLFFSFFFSLELVQELSISSWKFFSKIYLIFFLLFFFFLFFLHFIYFLLICYF